MKQYRNLLVLTGMAVCTIGQLLSHFSHMPDFPAGLIQGGGIGLLILALIGRRYKTDKV